MIFNYDSHHHNNDYENHLNEENEGAEGDEAETETEMVSSEWELFSSGSLRKVQTRFTTNSSINFHLILGNSTQIRRAAHGRFIAIVDGCQNSAATKSNNDHYEESIEPGQPFTKHYLQENQVNHCLSSLFNSPSKSPAS